MKQFHRRGFSNNYRALLMMMLMFVTAMVEAQTYNPSLHVVINSAMGEAQAAPLDARSFFYDQVNFVYRFYQNTSEVLSYLNLAKYRTGNFLIVIDSGGTLQPNGTYVNAHATFWMFKDSTANANLVELNLFGGGGVTSFNGRTGVVMPLNGDYTFSQIASTPTTLAGYGISDGVSLTGTQTITNKTINGLNNTLANIQNSSLVNNSIGLTLGTAGSDVNVGVTPAQLGSSLLLNLPNSGPASRGVITAANFTYFSGKVDSVHFSGDSIYDYSGGVARFRGFVTGTGGIASLNGITASSQTFATGTSGSDFNIISAGTSHTFNFPNASGSNRGLLLSADWTTFNSKQPQLNGTGFVKATGTTISYDNSTYITNITGLVTAGSGISVTGSGTSGSPYVIANTGSGGTVTNFSFTNGNGFTGNVTNPTTTPTLSIGTSITGLIFGNGTAIAAATVSSPLTYSAGTLGIQVANASQNGYLSSADWNTFNGKQGAISLTTTGTTGAATLASNTLNIPQYQGQLTLTTTGTSGASTLIGNTLNIPQYSGGGTSLPSGVTPLYLQATGASTYQWGDPRQLDTSYVVSDGQSNAIGGAEDVGDTASDFRVLVMDTVTRQFKVAHVGFTPFQTLAPASHSANGTFYFCRKLARTTGKYVKWVMSGLGGTSITGWFNTTTRGPRTDTLLQRLAAANFPRIDYFIWEQGESDPTMSSTQWSNAFDSLRFTVRRQVYQQPNTTTRWAIVGMPDTLSGAQPGFQGQEPTMVAYGYGGDPWVSFATLHILPGGDTVHVNAPGGNQIHLSQGGYQKLGEERLFACFGAIPMRDFERNNPGGVVPGSTINPGLIHVTWTSAAGGGAVQDGVTVQNNAPTGMSGMGWYSNDNGATNNGFIGITGTAATYFGPNEFVIGTRTNTNLHFFRNLVSQHRLTANGDSCDVPFIYAPVGNQAFKIYNSNTAAGAAFNLLGPTGNDFGIIGINNASAATFPSSMFAFYGNNYHLVMNGNGAVVGNGASTTFPANPRAGWDVNTSSAMRVDSFSATFSLSAANNRNAWVKTGNTNDTCFLPSAIKFGLEYWVMKTDNGTGTVTIYDGTNGHGINRVQGGSVILTNQFDAAYIQADGNGGWYIKYIPSGGGGVTTVGTFSASSQTNGATISGSTITFGPADATNPGMIKASGAQILGPVLTMPAPKFTGLVSAGANDSVLMWNPSTNQVEFKAGSTNIVASNGLQPGQALDSIILGGSLNQKTIIDQNGFDWYVKTDTRKFAFTTTDTLKKYFVSVGGNSGIKEFSISVQRSALAPVLGIAIDTVGHFYAGSGVSITEPTPFPNQVAHLGSTMFDAGIAAKYNVITANTTLTTSYLYIYVDCSGGNVTLTLPAVISSVSGNINSGTGIVYHIKRVDNSANTCTVTAAGSDTIDGSASITFSSLQSRELHAVYSNNWYVH